jgi:hypothetical protein
VGRSYILHVRIGPDQDPELYDFVKKLPSGAASGVVRRALSDAIKVNLLTPRGLIVQEHQAAQAEEIRRLREVIRHLAHEVPSSVAPLPASPVVNGGGSSDLGGEVAGIDTPTPPAVVRRLPARFASSLMRGSDASAQSA